MLKGAEPVIEVAGDVTVGTFLVKNDTWVQCTVGPEATTLAGQRPLAAEFVQDDPTLFQVSSDISDFSQQSMTPLRRRRAVARRRDGHQLSLPRRSRAGRRGRH